MMVDDIAKLILRHRYRFANEDDLQMGLAQVFTGACLPFEREVILSKGGPYRVGMRIDFMIGDEGLGLEVKIAGTLTSLTSQLLRYAQSDRISALILVTSRHFHTDFPGRLNQKPLRVAYLNSF